MSWDAINIGRSDYLVGVGWVLPSGHLCESCRTVSDGTHSVDCRRPAPPIYDHARR